MKKITQKIFIIILLLLNSKAMAADFIGPQIIVETELPIIYREEFNIYADRILQKPSFGLTNKKLKAHLTKKIHLFDGTKYKKVYNHLVNKVGIEENKFYKPEMVSKEDLLLVHAEKYISSLKNSINVSNITVEAPYLGIIRNPILHQHLLVPMKYATGGTILGCNLALDKGWAINLSGGYHHAKAEKGGGFCVYADIPIAAYKTLENQDDDFKILIVDLDAHQGNGHEAIFRNGKYKNNKKQIYIFDMYTEDNYPADHAVKKYIDFNYPMARKINTEEYFKKLTEKLPTAITKSKPNLIIYNAGTDIFYKDPIGGFNVSEKGIIERDAFVFQTALDNNIPILMVLSGGYSKESAGIIGRSIENILNNILRVI